MEFENFQEIIAVFYSCYPNKFRFGKVVTRKSEMKRDGKFGIFLLFAQRTLPLNKGVKS